jgi:membrane fusion protein, heavy metal efflux system
MKVGVLSTLLLVVISAGTMSAQSQAQSQKISLDAATSARLGLVFQRVAAPTTGEGARFAATVIASPLAVNEVHSVHAGVLESWQVQPGERVSAGQLVGVIRSEDIAALQQQWVAAAAQAELDNKALVRDNALLADGIIAAQRVQTTEQAAKASAFQKQALASQLEQSGYDAAERTALQRGTVKAGTYFIKAPTAGIITHLRHVSGARVAEGESLLTLAGDSLWVSAEIPVRLRPQLAVEQRLQLADSNAALTVRQLDQAVDAVTQTLGLLAEFTAPVSLLPGQVVTLVLPPQQAGVVVPADAVVRNGNDRVVFVRSATGVDGADGVESRVLTLQPLGADYLATSGLTAGEQVVVRGAAVLKGITLGLGGE